MLNHNKDPTDICCNFNSPAIWYSAPLQFDFQFGHFRGARMAQRWEYSPPTDVARDRFSNSTQYVGWVCCWFSLLREVFLRLLRFSPLSAQKPTFPNSNSIQISVTNSDSVEVPLQIPIYIFYFYCYFSNFKWCIVTISIWSWSSRD